MKTYSFRQQLQLGQKAERAIADILKNQFEVVEASHDQQRQGIDILGRHRISGQYLRFEIKSDLLAHQYGNAFVEIISNDAARKPGWVFTCTADILLYFIPGCSKLLFFRPFRLRDRTWLWEQRFPVKPSQNFSYRTWGICVPLAEFAPLAEAIATVRVRGFYDIQAKGYADQLSKKQRV